MVVDPGERRAAVQKFADDFGWSFDVLMDPHQRVAKEYGVRGHPMTFIISPKGKLLGTVIGFRDWSSPTAYALVNSLMSND